MNSKMDKIEAYDGRELWNVLPRYFLRKMELTLDNKVYKSGVFQNYKTVTNQYRLKFKGDTKILVIPTPFEILVQGNIIILDYRCSTLFRGDEKLINTLKRVKKQDASEVFDKILKITME